MTTDYIDAPDDPTALTDLLLNGWDLRAYLSPDPALPYWRQEQAYTETLQLSFVIIADSVVWGVTRHNHLSFAPGKSKSGLNAFAYSPQKSYYACVDHISPQKAIGGEKQGLNFFPLKQYTVSQFRLASTHEPVWRMQTADDLSPFDAAIRQGRSFRLAIQFGSDVWVISPVDIPYRYIDQDRFKVTTDCCFLPGVLARPAAAEQKIRELLPSFLDTDDVMQQVSIQTATVSSFVEFYNDGSYYDLSKIKDARPAVARDAVILAER